MVLLIYMKIQMAGDQYSLTLPKKVIEGMGWGKGDTLKVEIAGKNRLELVKELP